MKTTAPGESSSSTTPRMSGTGIFFGGSERSKRACTRQDGSMGKYSRPAKSRRAGASGSLTRTPRRPWRSMTKKRTLPTARTVGPPSATSVASSTRSPGARARSPPPSPRTADDRDAVDPRRHLESSPRRPPRSKVPIRGGTEAGSTTRPSAAEPAGFAPGSSHQRPTTDSHPCSLVSRATRSAPPGLQLLAVGGIDRRRIGPAAPASPPGARARRRPAGRAAGAAAGRSRPQTDRTATETMPRARRSGTRPRNWVRSLIAPPRGRPPAGRPILSEC